MDCLRKVLICPYTDFSTQNRKLSSSSFIFTSRILIKRLIIKQEPQVATTGEDKRGRRAHATLRDMRALRYDTYTKFFHMPEQQISGERRQRVIY